MPDCGNGRSEATRRHDQNLYQGRTAVVAAFESQTPPIHQQLHNGRHAKVRATNY
jgi:hypothetical protein